MEINIKRSALKFHRSVKSTVEDEQGFCENTSELNLKSEDSKSFRANEDKLINPDFR
ncbi:hypothetical protein SK128_023238 [Halocaridina rubra]|uniref:Uncharacterized protein n=1 Tax=Halocaridina rubra TaxID=373956 RepID=A0AAN8X8E5_HALRR